MPISSSTLVRTTAALMLAGLAALLVIVGMSLWLGNRSQDHFNEVLAARDLRAATLDFRTALQDAETGQRGFLLTQDEVYLAPYNQARQELESHRQRLTTLLQSRPNGDGISAAIDDAAAVKLTELEETIRLARSGDREAALALVQADTGQIAMSELRELLTGIVQDADQRLAESVAQQRGSASALYWTSLIGALVIIAVVGGSAWVVILYTREIAEARRLLSTTNITLEERVAERTAELARANEEVQRFAYIVTHDLRAPLVNIMGFTSELEASIKPIRDYMERSDVAGDDQLASDARLAATEDLPEAVGFIRSSTRKMDGLINAILKISRDGRRPIRAESIDLTNMLQASANAIQHQVGELDGVIEVADDLPTILSDRMSLDQIFGNLLDNAVKYADASRPLRIKISGEKLIGNRIAIDVADNGRGIAADDHERVFELFRRSGEQSKPGEGIGLAHVRTLVRNLGGDITVTSELGKGSTFRVVLARDMRRFIGSMQ
ncbi:CHASE3 domain-containing protein [Georhizobium sp. MAB10]|uniref:sensor histidine kinase n=1 Tax=Georhizobium sp. MAB10 TaxID=3028319 RepID=UPI0038557D57